MFFTVSVAFQLKQANERKATRFIGKNV